jgi:hypothetical protein
MEVGCWPMLRKVILFMSEPRQPEGNISQQTMSNFPRMEHSEGTRITWERAAQVLEMRCSGAGHPCVVSSKLSNDPVQLR